LEKVQTGRDYFGSAQQQLQNTALNQSPPVNFNELKTTLSDIEKVCDDILKRPKPTPPKEEKKEEKTLDEEAKNGQTEGNKMEEEAVNEKEEPKADESKMDME